MQTGREGAFADAEAARLLRSIAPRTLPVRPGAVRALGRVGASIQHAPCHRDRPGRRHGGTRHLASAVAVQPALEGRAVGEGLRRGRRTSSPEQFGQRNAKVSVQAGQNVHSWLQI